MAQDGSRLHGPADEPSVRCLLRFCAQPVESDSLEGQHKISRDRPASISGWKFQAMTLLKGLCWMAARN